VAVASFPRRELHVFCDNYASHKHPAVRAWLAKHPRITLHFTPTSGSWMNLVEVFFGIITRQAIRRGTFTSVADLEAAIGIYIDAWNQRCQPFTWNQGRRHNPGPRPPAEEPQHKHQLRDTPLGARRGTVARPSALPGPGVARSQPHGQRAAAIR
jgi:transposase